MTEAIEIGFHVPSDISIFQKPEIIRPGENVDDAFRRLFLKHQLGECPDDCSICRAHVAD